MHSQIKHSLSDVLAALRDVKDPEIPVISLVDLHVIRDLRVEHNSVSVRMVPTFSGCPALEAMKQDVERRLRDLGFESVEITVDRSGKWSTNELSETTRETLRSFGIAPPPQADSVSAALLLPVKCPFCGSAETQLEGEFGSTLCKQLFFCSACRQSFERFKPL